MSARGEEDCEDCRDQGEEGVDTWGSGEEGMGRRCHGEAGMGTCNKESVAAQGMGAWPQGCVCGPLAVQSSVSLNLFLTPMQDIPTLRQLWAHDQQVIVSYEDETSVGRHTELWPGIPYWWGNQAKSQAVLQYLETMRSCGRPGATWDIAGGALMSLVSQIEVVVCEDVTCLSVTHCDITPPFPFPLQVACLWLASTSQKSCPMSSPTHPGPWRC